ncbi:glycosyltransferase [Porticoccaceae bacterium]|nr:glycosyltransferase [Porticoccaceae bacterium]
MKNILVLCANMKKGGAERVISLLLSEFIKDKNLSLHFVQMESGLDYELPEDLHSIILSDSKKGSIRKFIELPYVAFQISNYIKNNDIDIVISFLYRPNYVNILSKLFGANFRCIINVRSTTSRYIYNGLLGKVNLFLVKNLFNRSDLIISNSKGVDDDLKSLFQVTTATKVIHNPIDLDNIAKSSRICEDHEFNFRANVKYIISVGRLIPLKKNIDLIEAFHNLQKEDSNLELIFLGDGPSKNSLKGLSKKLGISSKIYFLGNVSNPFYYLKRSNLFVLNSEIEGFPNVLVEAMACNLPVISSDCKSGPREILQNEKYGLLYPVGDVKELVAKMKYYLYSNIDLQKVKDMGQERVINFDKNKIVNQFKGAL